MKIKLLVFSFIGLLICISSTQNIRLIERSNYEKIIVFDLNTQANSNLSNFIDSTNLSVLIFHSITCPFNRVYNDKIDKLKSIYKNDSVNFMYVNANSFENNINNVNNEVSVFSKSRAEPYFLDTKRELKALFNVKKNGTIIVCKKLKNSNIRLYYKGPLDDSPQSENTKNNLLNEAISNALKNKETNVSLIQTGCRITNH